MLIAGLAAACGPAESIVQAPVEALAGCPSIVEQPRRDLPAAPIVEGPFTSHVNEAWRRGRELIEVRWLPISSVWGMHEVLIYTNAGGEQFIVAGFPEVDFSLTLQLGSIVMFTGPFDPASGEPFRQDFDKDSARKVVARGEDLSATWEEMKRIAAVIDRLGVDYDLPGPNSNSAAETVLKYAGFPPTEDGISGDVGSGIDVIAYARSQGNVTCDDPNDDVNRAAR